MIGTKGLGRLFGHTEPRTRHQLNRLLLLLFALVYRAEVVSLLELKIPLLRITIQEGLTKDENHKFRSAELEAFDEKRLRVQQKLECYQTAYHERSTKRYECIHFRLKIKCLR